VKFLADMGISPKTVAFLHALGHDAVHLSEQGLERLPDLVPEKRPLLACVFPLCVVQVQAWDQKLSARPSW
jgi:Domain of unknown function (DUF5615)